MDKQHVKRVQALFKSALQPLYHIYCSLLTQFNRKKSLLLTFQIFRPFANILPGIDKYPVLNSEN